MSSQDHLHLSDRRCPQPKAEVPLNYTDQQRQENCLYLNIWSPASGCHISVEPCSGVRTVLLFLFSLGFSRGGGDWYDGSAFAAVGGVVVVAPNYRLGLLAFGVPGTVDHSGKIVFCAMPSLSMLCSYLS